VEKTLAKNANDKEMFQRATGLYDYLGPFNSARTKVTTDAAGKEIGIVSSYGLPIIGLPGSWGYVLNGSVVRFGVGASLDGTKIIPGLNTAGKKPQAYLEDMLTQFLYGGISTPWSFGPFKGLDFYFGMTFYGDPKGNHGHLRNAVPKGDGLGIGTGFRLKW
jgi:hypothetical protein